MKKSMSRVLSLALVLVMLLGVMPLALAADREGPSAGEGTVPGHNHESTDWKWVDDADNSKPATCTEEGVKAQKCSVSGCTATQKETLPRLDHNVTDWKFVNGGDCVKGGTMEGTCTMCNEKQTKTVAAGTHTPSEGGQIVEAATCMKPGKKLVDCSVCGTKYEVEIPVDANAHHFDETTGKCTNKDADGKVCDAVDPNFNKVTVTISATTMTLKVNEGKQLTVGLNKPEGATGEVTITKVEWTPSNETVKVEGKGETAILTGLKKGTTAIQAAVTLSTGEIMTVKCDVTVEDDASIKQNNVATKFYNGATVTLNPELSYNPGKQIAWSYESLSNNATVSQNGVVTATGSGEAKIRITATWGTGTDEKEVKTVYVSFYDTQNSAVTVKKDSFLFTDKNVFSSVSVDGVREIAPQNWSTTMLLGTGIPYWSVYLEELSGGKNAKITYTDGDFDKFKPSGTNYAFIQLQKLKFTCLNKGEYKLAYEGYSENNLKLREGTITFQVAEGEADIIYKTSHKRNVTLNETDFVRYWQKSGMRGTPKCVTFDARPTYGELYTRETLGDKINLSTQFVFSGNENRLGRVVYKPLELANKYEEQVAFTMYGENSNDIVYGTILFKVGSDMNFRDVHTSDWFYEHVQYVYDNGIMDGVSAYEFAPQNKLTRGMVVTMLHRMEGKPSTFRTGTFTDVQRGTWYTDAVEWAAENKIVEGYGSTFGPNNNITRQDLAVILYRYAKYKGQSTYNSSSLTGFGDYQNVASYATDAMQWAVYNKIIGGNERGMLVPQGNATRAEAAKMFHVFLENK